MFQIKLKAYSKIEANYVSIKPLNGDMTYQDTDTVCKFKK